MRTRHGVVLFAVAGAALLAALNWWAFAPRRAVQGFVGDLSHGRYAEASARLEPPSAILLQHDGSLQVVDCRGHTSVVPADQLPFHVAGDARAAGFVERLRGPEEFSMMALGKAVDGVLTAPPVAMHLQATRDRLTIDRVG